MRRFHEVRWSNLWLLWLFATKKDARYSSDSVGGTSAAGTSESASLEKWKDEDLGWFPTQRANILNSQIVFCQNSTCSFGPLVPTRNAFATVS